MSHPDIHLNQLELLVLETLNNDNMDNRPVRVVSMVTLKIRWIQVAAYLCNEIHFG